MFQRSTIKSVLTLLLFCFVALYATSLIAAQTLSKDDCVKCHETQPAQIKTAGAAHESKINCIDCHSSHKPVSSNNIPTCAQCHDGTDHYTLDNCMSCHNPHQPLVVSLKGELKAECLTCHTSQNEQLLANPSMHTEVSCNFCHADTHGNIPECAKCHEPHSEEMVQGDCSTCHEVHQPTVLEYPATTKNVLCAACHDTAFDELQSSTTKHHEIGCVECHATKHMTVPQCADCHNTPHPAGIHAKFPQCGTCHNTAHDLNNLTLE